VKNKPIWRQAKTVFWKKSVQMKTRECIVCAHKIMCLMLPWTSTTVIPIPVTTKIFWRVHVDWAGKIPVTSKGNQYISVPICAFSKYIEAKGNSCIIFKTFTSLYSLSFSWYSLSLPSRNKTWNSNLQWILSSTNFFERKRNFTWSHYQNCQWVKNFLVKKLY